MGNVRCVAATMVAVSVAVLAGGCVGLEEHQRVKFALNKCQAKSEELARDLEDCRARSASFDEQLLSRENELASQKAMAANLQAENNRLNNAYDKIQAEFSALVKKLGMPTPIVLERVLPAELDKALKDFAAAHSDAVEYDPKKGVVKWKSDLLFALGSDVVKTSAIDALRSFAQIVTSAAASGFDVIIVGHTDNIPIVKAETRAKHPTNWHLSAHRAISVMNQLRKFGITAERVGVMGYGEYRPVAPNTTEENRQKNRRVEIFLVSPEAVPPSAD